MESEYELEFGDAIRVMRQEKNLTSSQLAKESGISQAYLSQLETGRNKKPAPDILRKLSKGLTVPYSLLLQIAGYIDDANKEIEDSTDDKINTYKEIRDIAGLTMYEEYTFELEELFSEGTKLTNNGKLLTGVDKKKILTLIDTILN